MHAEPLLPGQEFSFMEPIVAATFRSSGIHNSGGWVIMPVTSPYEGGEPRYHIQPSERMIVLEDTHVDAGGCWRVPVWYGSQWFGRMIMSFPQQLSSEVAADIFEPAAWRYDQPGAIPVTNVRWPAPTPESLMIQARVLSYWGEVAPWAGPPSPHAALPWEWCETLTTLPLSEGIPRVVDALSIYIPNPAGVLRERGFAV